MAASASAALNGFSFGNRRSRCPPSSARRFKPSGEATSFQKSVPSSPTHLSGMGMKYSSYFVVSPSGREAPSCINSPSFPSSPSLTSISIASGFGALAPPFRTRRPIRTSNRFIRLARRRSCSHSTTLLSNQSVSFCFSMFCPPPNGSLHEAMHRARRAAQQLDRAVGEQRHAHVLRWRQPEVPRVRVGDVRGAQEVQEEASDGIEQCQQRQEAPGELLPPRERKQGRRDRAEEQCVVQAEIVPCAPGKAHRERK